MSSRPLAGRCPKPGSGTLSPSDRARSGKFRAQIGDVDLPQRFRLGDAVQREPSQASEGDALGETFSEGLVRRGREQDLATVARPAHACGDVDGDPDVASVGKGWTPGM